MFRLLTDRPSVPFSQLVRKLSEVEGIPPNINIIGKTSLDEGVDVFENNENQQKLLHGHNHIHVRSFEGQQGHASHSYGALAQKAFAATAPSSQVLIYINHSSTVHEGAFYQLFVRLSSATSFEPIINLN